MANYSSNIVVDHEHLTANISFQMRIAAMTFAFMFPLVNNNTTAFNMTHANSKIKWP